MVKGNYQKMVAFLKLVVNHKCCLCDECCMACDALTLLHEMGEIKNDEPRKDFKLID